MMFSCGGGGGGGGEGGKVKVGLLVTGSTSDGGWNQLAKDALEKIALTEGVEVRTQQQVGKDKAADAIRQFDSQGFALVIAHGFEYQDVAKELTDPAKNGAVKVKVVVSGGNADSPHFQALEYDLSGASYQLGVIAAKVSKSGKLGFIGGAKFDTVTAMQRGFMAGAKSVKPDVTFAEAWPGWDDPSKAKREAEAMIAQGVDVIMQNVDAASRGVFEAVKEHNGIHGKEQAPVYTFGANSDQNANPVCGEFTLASAVIKMDVAFTRVIKEVKGGTFKGGVQKVGVASGVSVAVINPKLAGTVIDEATQKLVEEAGKKLASGELKVPRE
jgi:basic membrane protein A and related proteins